MIAKLRRNLREWGVRGTAANVAKRLREGRSTEEMIVLLKDLDSIAEPRRRPSLRVEELEERHYPGVREMSRRRDDPDHAVRFFDYCVAQGFHGFVAFSGEEVVGYYWWVDRDADSLHPSLWNLGKRFNLEPGDVYGDSLFLLEGHRGGNAAAEFLFQVESRLRELGYRRLWGFVDSRNRQARWLYSTRGYKAMWKVQHRRVVFFHWRRSVPVDEGSERR